MKPIKRHRTFQKSFNKRVFGQEKLIKQLEERLKLFAAGVRGWPLDDHPLTGKLTGKRAFSVSGDIRVIYYEFEDHILLVDIGTHNQVY